MLMRMKGAYTIHHSAELHCTTAAVQRATGSLANCKEWQGGGELDNAVNCTASLPSARWGGPGVALVGAGGRAGAGEGRGAAELRSVTTGGWSGRGKQKEERLVGSGEIHRCGGVGHGMQPEE